MPITKRYILLALFILGAWLPTIAQEMTEEEQYNAQFQAEMSAQLNKLTSELDILFDDANKQLSFSERDIRSAYTVRTLDAKAQSLNRRLQALNVRWDAFNASYLSFISENDTLMEQMTQAQLLKQTLTDTIAAQQTKCQTIKDFMAAEQLILAQDSLYHKLYQQAYRLSFVQKLTPQLEKLKAQEQAHFLPIQEAYEKVKTAAETVPQLRTRADQLNERFYAIKAQSEQIQQMKYMPLMQRFKDYLLGLASVAVLILLFNNLMSKYKAAKQKKETLQKQAELLKKQQNDYPTI